MGVTDVNELYAVAHANTQRILPGSIRDMEDIFDDFADSTDEAIMAQLALFDEEEREANRKKPMYVATNTERMNGAITILYDGLLQDFAERVGDDLYLMPSSLHEMIIVPAMGTKPQGLGLIVQDYNRLLAEPGEILSDSLYYYDRFTGSVRIA